MTYREFHQEKRIKKISQCYCGFFFLKYIWHFQIFTVETTISEQTDVHAYTSVQFSSIQFNIYILIHFLLKYVQFSFHTIRSYYFVCNNKIVEMCVCVVRNCVHDALFRCHFQLFLCGMWFCTNGKPFLVTITYHFDNGVKVKAYGSLKKRLDITSLCSVLFVSKEFKLYIGQKCKLVVVQLYCIY